MQHNETTTYTMRPVEGATREEMRMGRRRRRGTDAVPALERCQRCASRGPMGGRGPAAQAHVYETPSPAVHSTYGSTSTYRLSRIRVYSTVPQSRIGRDGGRGIGALRVATRHARQGGDGESAIRESGPSRPITAVCSRSTNQLSSLHQSSGFRTSTESRSGPSL